MCSGRKYGWSRMRPRVRDGLRRLLPARRRAPARVRVFEEFEVFGRVHARDRRRAVQPRRLRGAELGARDRVEDAVDALGDLGRFHEPARVEERLAGMVRAMGVGSDDQHSGTL